MASYPQPKEIFNLQNILSCYCGVNNKVSLNRVYLIGYDNDYGCFIGYYPFGSPMVGRGWEAGNTGDYRFGMNGQEEDDEIYGDGNSTSAEFWQYDARLGRRWNVDPVTKEYESPYSCFGNNPIWFVDQDGADSTIYVNFKGFKDKIMNDPGNADLSTRQKKKIYEYQKAKFVTQLEDIYRNDGINLNVVETTMSFEAVKSKLNTSDQFLEFGNLNEDELGKTEGMNHQHSIVNLYDELNIAIFGGFTMWIANVAAHETYHGYLERHRRFYKLTNADIGLDGDDHNNSSPNIMMKGARRTIVGSGVKINYFPNKGTQDYKKYLLLSQHKTIIKNWISSDISRRQKKGAMGPNPYLSQNFIKHSEVKRINY